MPGGRPKSEGVLYFSVDCQFNDSVKLIQAEFGLVGIGLLVKLWQKIYGEKGYYTKWDADVALVFSSGCGVGVNVVNEVVSACLRRGLFDRAMFEKHKILTSDGIQERFAAATSRRESQKICGDYLLISAPKNWVIVYNNSISVDGNSKNVDDNSQSKVKVKEKEIPNGISIYSPSNSPQDAASLEGAFEAFWEAYPKKRGKADARKAFMKIKNPETLISKMLSAIKDQKESKEWKKDGGQYIPYPSKWLNNGQWEDVIEEVAEENQGVALGNSFDTEDFFKAALERSMKG